MSDKAGYCFDTRTVTTTDGRVLPMPPDDGFDEAFRYILEHPGCELEEVLPKTSRPPLSLYAKLLRCGWQQSYLVEQFAGKFRNRNESKQVIDALLLN